MKRSRINAAILMAKGVLDECHFKLPSFAYWTPEQWTQAGPEYDRVKFNGLGWDVTDFGRNEFDSLGGVLFTLRNGNHKNPEQGTPYAEKVIILKAGQRLPLHFHWSKTEDIINRSGGVLAIELYQAAADDSVDRSSSVQVYCDGCRRQLGPGAVLELLAGQSITLTPRLYHKFWAKEGAGMLVCGEVSTVNDDSTDNCFAEGVPRFADIEEDEAPLHLLCNEYPG